MTVDCWGRYVDIAYILDRLYIIGDDDYAAILWMYDGAGYMRQHD